MLNSIKMLSKWKGVAIIIATLYICTGYSQRIIYRAGLTSSRISFQDLYLTHKQKFGGSVSIGYEMPLKNQFNLRNELSFLQRGCFIKIGDSKSKLTLYYLELSPLLSYSKSINNFRLNFMTGPSASIAVAGFNRFYADDGNIRDRNVTFSRPPSGFNDYQSYYSYVNNRLDYGFKVGAEMEYKRLLFGLRYTQGFSKLYTFENRDYLNYYNDIIANAKNRSLEISLGYVMNRPSRKVRTKKNYPIQAYAKSGITISTITYDFGNGKRPDALTGFIVGAGFEFSPGQKFSWLVELDFIQKGTQWNWDGDDYKLRTNYVEIPFLLKYKKSWGKHSIFGLGGVSVGYGLGGHFVYKSPTGQENLPVVFQPFQDDNTLLNYYRYIDYPVDLGLMMGTGFSFFQKVNLEIRYGFGLTYLYNTKHDKGSFQDNSIRTTQNRNLQVTIAVPFKLRGK